MTEVDIWFDERGRCHDFDNGRFCKAPECYDCGERLTVEEINQSLETPDEYADEYVAYEPDRVWLQCFGCYRDTYGCENCVWAEGDRFCTGVCRGEED
jgi:hypothetical protein